MRLALPLLACLAALAFISCSPPASTSAAAVPDSARDNTFGPAAAAVTIEEWGDFQCPACGEFATLQPRLDQMVLADGNTRFVFHHMAFLGPESILAAEGAECAGDQGHFWDYYRILYASQNGENRGAFSGDHLKSFAGSVGLDLDQTAFNTCLDSHRNLSRVVLETKRGKDLGVNSTPSLFVNGKRVVLTATRDPIETLQLAVQAAKTR